MSVRLAIGRLLSRETSGKPDLRLTASDPLSLDVHGESHHMPALERLAVSHGVDLRRDTNFDLDDLWLRIVPEPTNRYDPNAVMVCSPDRECLGYLPRELAPDFAGILSELAKEHDLWCHASMGGGRQGHPWRIGVWLDIPAPTDLASQAVAQASTADLSPTDALYDLTCPKCGTEQVAPAGQHFCPMCGFPIDVLPPPRS